MNFEIPCDVYARLSAIPLNIPTDEINENLRSICIERKNGSVYAITSDRKIAAIEYIGPSQEPDGFTHVAVAAALVEAAIKESAFDGKFHLVANDMLKFTSLKSSFGFQPTSNVGIYHNGPKDEAFTNWRDWPPALPVRKSRGAMFWTGNLIATLAKTAPSGTVIFPEFIDVNEPVILRDPTDDSWCGLFMGVARENDQRIVSAPAKLPDWFK